MGEGMKKLLLGTALATLAFATAAQAAIVISPGSGNLKTFNDDIVGSHGGTSNWAPGPITWSTGANSFATNTSVVDQYLAPLGDSSIYIFATTNSDATVSWGKTIHSFNIYWGSPDTYNTLTLSNGDSVTGGAVGSLFGFTANGDNANTRWVHIYDAKGFTGFVASSTQAAFEFDGTAVPEPATWALMLAGFAALGFAGHRSRKNVADVA
jgi:hypothetical protein